MKRLLRNFRCGELGFTLIELLVVVAILAALAGVVTLAVTQFIGKGECEAYCTEKHNVQTALVAAGAENQGDCSNWENYIIGETKYTWNPDTTTCKPGDASDAPQNCKCLEPSGGGE